MSGATTIGVIGAGNMAGAMVEGWLRADPDRNRAILDRIPAGRWGRAEDIGHTAVFLSASASNYINGAVLNVDGGWLAR